MKYVKKFSQIFESVTPTVIPSNLGFQIVDSPVGDVVDYQTGQSSSSNIQNTNLQINGGAQITIQKSKGAKGQVTFPGTLYFRLDGKKPNAKLDATVGGSDTGIESGQALAGKYIPKTIWFDCATMSFYVWYDSMKVVFYKSNAANQGGGIGTANTQKFRETLEFFQKNFCLTTTF